MEVKEQKEYREERFEFALYVNENIICKRNFRINNFIEDSMNSVEFKHTVDEIINMIDDDLKSKSRVYTWYFFDEKAPDEEFTNPLIDPWECTFKFVVLDNKREIITKIWDGRGYPKSVREKVDLANKFVKIIGKDGKITSYEKEKYFEQNQDKLSHDLYVLKNQIMDKGDVLLNITRKICEVCSPKEGMQQSLKDFTMSETYRNFEYGTDENGKIVAKRPKKGKKYFFGANAYKKFMHDWGNAVSEKTKKYFDNLYK